MVLIKHEVGETHGGPLFQGTWALWWGGAQTICNSYSLPACQVEEPTAEGAP